MFKSEVSTIVHKTLLAPPSIILPIYLIGFQSNLVTAALIAPLTPLNTEVAPNFAFDQNPKLDINLACVCGTTLSHSPTYVV